MQGLNEGVLLQISQSLVFDGSLVDEKENTLESRNSFHAGTRLRAAKLGL